MFFEASFFGFSRLLFLFFSVCFLQFLFSFSICSTQGIKRGRPLLRMTSGKAESGGEMGERVEVEKKGGTYALFKVQC